MGCFATHRKLFLSHTDFNKVESALKGLEIRSVRSSDAMLSRVYGFLAGYFPKTEYDPFPVWKQALVDTDKDCLFPGFGTVFLKSLCFVVIDKIGRYGKKNSIIAYADGTFEGNKKTNVFYLAHIAVCAKARRHGIATALVNAVLFKCHEYAKNAETCLKTKYKTVRNTGLKIRFMILDIEFVSMHEKKSVKESVSRLIFHGTNGVSICNVSDVRYAQSDTRHSSARYNPKRWFSIPMFFGVRAVGNEKLRFLSGSEAKNLLDLMYSGFMACMNPEGVSADHSYSVRHIRDRVRIHPLPDSEIEAVKFVRQQGDIYKLLRSFYRNHNFTIKFAEKLKPEFKPEDIPFVLK